MPPDTGMHVGGDSGYNYFVLQLHYLHVDGFKNGRTDNSGNIGSASVGNICFF